MLKIRLARRGKKRQPFYRVVVADVEAKRDGRYVEQIGYYNPMKDPIEYLLKEDRALHWLSVGAQPTDAVRRLLVKQGTYDRLTRLRAGEEIEALHAEFDGRPWPPVDEPEESDEEPAVEVEAEPEAPAVEAEAEVAPVAEAEPEVEAEAEPVVEAAEDASDSDDEDTAEVAPVAVPEPEVSEPEPVAEVVADEPVSDPEPEPVVDEVKAEPKPKAKPKAKATKYKAAEGEDDLTKIEGIGPKIAATLQAAGVTTYMDLAASTSAKLKEIVSGAGISASPSTWPTQATLAATDDWDGLSELQDKLKAGRR